MRPDIRRIITLAATTGLLTTLPFAAQAQTAPQFARIFGDHAVLQRGQPVNIWGTAAPNAALTVTINGQTTSATAGADGKWKTALPALTAGGPYTLTVSDGQSTTTLNDILIGDVYLCSGQSNMEFPARLSTGAWGEIGASANPNLRFVNIEKDSAAAPRDDLKTAPVWKVAGPDTTGDASAVCYYMSKALQKEHKVPVGFIGTDWGGTTIQSWISPYALRTLPAYAAGVDAVAQYGASPEKAQAAHAKAQEAWWDAHDKSAKTQRAWISPAFNDSGWSHLKATGGWKDGDAADLKAFDGVVWLRTRVTLTADQAAKANELTLGPVDTFDTTWVNGQWVGSSGINWVWRDYKVPSGVFKAGENVIVLRILGSDGLIGTPDMRFVKTSDGQAIPLSADWTYKTGMAAKGLTIPAAPWDVPTSLNTLYNGMVAPLAPYTVKAAAWYQGESNADAATEYRTLLPMLMADWRKSFAAPDLPMLIVQLSSYGSVSTTPGVSHWAELREAQRLSVDADPHAALIVSHDFGDRSDIHPTQKNIIGLRAARAVDHLVFGQAVAPTGPEAISVTRAGADLVVNFRYADSGLKTYSSDTAIGFEACDAKDACRYVTAVVDGSRVVLKGANSPETGQEAIKVRYAWSDAPFTNLYSGDDQPAVPFELKVSQ
ncbi:sialate O-acetylesterase [Asticcacaulis taihuensis]|uniref:sialate O-acetylesterase n=1 Tax=Asticcacaulis taihuensis TaxID=260084 RepID=UPI003F7B87E9